MLQSYDEIFDKIRNLNGGRVLKKHSPAKKNAFGVFRARDGNRTRTGISAHRILSPACLPIPPPEQKKFANVRIFSLSV